MERHGVLIDAALLAAQSDELGAKMVTSSVARTRPPASPFNLGSTKQLGEILFGHAELPVLKKTMSGAPSPTRTCSPSSPRTIRCPRSCSSTGAARSSSRPTPTSCRMVNASTGRVHTSYAQSIAVTGRLSSNEPNLQNIPIRTAEGRRIREAFVAPPGQRDRLGRLLADRAADHGAPVADRNLLARVRRAARRPPRDRAEVFGRRSDEVSSEQRRYAKTINFGLIYGMSAFGLAAQLGIERDAAKTGSSATSRAIRACAVHGRHAGAGEVQATSRR
jgi:DNA polymerase-1